MGFSLWEIIELYEWETSYIENKGEDEERDRRGWLGEEMEEGEARQK